MHGKSQNRITPQQEWAKSSSAPAEIENDDGDTLKFRIVGHDEISDVRDYISIDSRRWRGRYSKKEVGDLAVVNTPNGEANWYVNAIEYVNKTRRILSSADGWHFASQSV